MMVEHLKITGKLFYDGIDPITQYEIQVGDFWFDSSGKFTVVKHWKSRVFENDARYLAQQMWMQPLIVEMALQAMEQLGLVEDVGGGLSRLNSPLEVIEE